MSKKNLQFEIRVLGVSKIFCYIVSFLFGFGALLPFAVAFAAPETESMAPLLRVVAISLLSGVLVILSSVIAGRIDSLIRFRKKEYQILLAKEEKKIIQKRIAARSAARSHT